MSKHLHLSRLQADANYVVGHLGIDRIDDLDKLHALSVWTRAVLETAFAGVEDSENRVAQTFMEATEALELSR